MSNARQTLQIVGTVLFGPIGGLIGGEIGGFIDGPPEGPRLRDLSAPQIEYGGKIPRLYGGPKWFEVSPLWMSEKRESSETVGGKGGDSGQEQFSYRVDMLVRLTESREGTPCEVLAITGVEIDGQLVWTALSDATTESIQASEDQEDWSTMTLLTGSETQSPWSVYEAAVGATNANAFRGYCTVGFEDMLLGQGGAPRRVRVQLITSGTPSETDFDCLLQANFVSDASDSSANNVTPTVTGGWTFDGSLHTGIVNTDKAISWAAPGMGIRSETGFTLHMRFTLLDFDFGDSGFSTNQILRLDWTSGANNYAFAVEAQRNVSEELQIRVTGGVDVYVTQVVDDDVEYHLAVQVSSGASPTLTIFLDGVQIHSEAYLNLPSDGTSGAQVRTEMYTTFGARGWDLKWVDFWARPLFASTFAAPLEPDAPDAPTTTWSATPVLLQDILEYEAERCDPLTSANIDFSAAAGLEVDCHVGIDSAAEVMQPLLTRFWFDIYSSDKLYLVRRGGSVEQTIPFEWTVGEEGFSGLKRANDIEVPKKKAVSYADLLKDGETDTRTGDRESPGSDVETLSMNLHMIPSEAQGLADTATADSRIGAHTATIKVGARHGLLLQPGSVATFVDHAGNSYRCLVRRIVWNQWEWELEVRLDDPQVLQASGIAVDVDQRALTVVPPPVATLYVLDIPLLREADNGAGEYVAATCTGRFRGFDLYKSSDNVTFVSRGEMANRAIAGFCGGALSAYAGWTWDNTSTLTVTLDEGSGGALSTATKTAVEADQSLNLAAVGIHGRWELLQFSTATLVTGTTYLLSGFLRNLFGTEQNNANHATADSFVLINTALGRISGAASDLGQTRYYKAVPRGRSINNVDPESIVCEEQCLLPYAPVDLRNDAGTLRWNRRSRLFAAVGIEPPVGEDTESYSVELDGVETDIVSTNEWTPVAPVSGETLLVAQRSAQVGDGHEASKAIA
jgi:Putative phage tail protein